MEWFLERGAPIAPLRHEVREYLERHASDTSGLDDAEVVVAELLSNVRRHADSAAWIALRWDEAQPTLTVRDLGPGFAADDFSPPEDPDRPAGRGLYLVSRLGAGLQVAMREHAGTEVTARLPVRREIERDARTEDEVAAVPIPVELRSASITRDSFLVALVSRLAQVVELEWGPSEVSRAVANVGRTISPQMEGDFRRAHDITGAMTPQQAADCLVALKHAIDGDFYVIEVADDHVKLGNRRCPFGPAVTSAPSLCQMTSSVFGGIAARNFGSSSVLLEERIAVGDPECRVTVWFGDAPEASAPFTRRYRAQATADAGGDEVGGPGGI